MKISLNIIRKLTFGVKLSPEEYDYYYSHAKDFNGTAPDEFIASRIKNHELSDVILDIGAGQGRNTIPIAKQGYKSVYAMEINSLGQSAIKESAQQNLVSDSVKILGSNILDKDLKFDNKVNLAFMTHVTQHFSLEDLKQFFANMYENLVPGGELVFDALIGKKKNGMADDFGSFIKEMCGCHDFSKEDVINTAKSTGFKLDFISKFCEKSQNRADYEHSWGNTAKQGLEEAKKMAKNSPKLLWFVFKK